MVHSSPLPDVALPDVALDRLVPRSGLPAITEYDTGRTVTYAELGALADAAATRLRSRGVGGKQGEADEEGAFQHGNPRRNPSS